MFFFRFGPQHSRNIFQSPHQGTKPGDLIFDGEYYFLNLGEDISRIEQGYEQKTIHPYEILPDIVSSQSLEFIHRMVYERYSSYNKIVPMFIGHDITIVIKNKQQTKHKKKIPQSLFLFPNILSIQQYINQYPIHKNSLILSGSSTTLQKAKAYWSISNNTAQVLLCTHSQIFQNRSHLTEVHFMDRHSPYYHTFQDPRYTITSVIDKMKDIYSIL